MPRQVYQPKTQTILATVALTLLPFKLKSGRTLFTVLRGCSKSSSMTRDCPVTGNMSYSSKLVADIFVGVEGLKSSRRPRGYSAWGLGEQEMSTKRVLF